MQTRRDKNYYFLFRDFDYDCFVLSENVLRNCVVSLIN